VKQGVDYIAASFVSRVEDVRELRKLLDENGGEHVQIMPKIESLTSLHNLNSIFKESDAIMLARGDLGVEIPYEEVPFYQQLIIAKARAFGLPVVVATQMLESMLNSPVPSRAEVTDINFAVSLAADATMLSGETSKSEYPKEAVEVMQKVKSEAEKHFNYREAYMQAYAYVPTDNAETSYEIAHRALGDDIEAIFTFTTKGRLVRALAAFRVKAPIIAMVPNKKM
jgi:pyruvate kinase